MTELRQRMLDAMVQRGFSPRTQETYVGADVGAGLQEMGGKGVAQGVHGDVFCDSGACARAFKLNGTYISRMTVNIR